jgi:hypothetical protein
MSQSAWIEYAETGEVDWPVTFKQALEKVTEDADRRL